jgi:hypothetical protein
MEEHERRQAIKDIELPFLSPGDFIDKQKKSLLEKHAEWSR